MGRNAAGSIQLHASQQALGTRNRRNGAARQPSGNRSWGRTSLDRTAGREGGRVRDGNSLMPRLIVISLVLLMIGGALWAGYASQGSYVDVDGVLREPFYLLALGWFFVLAGGAVMVLGAGVAILNWNRRQK